MHGKAVPRMKEVNGWLAPDAYDGCRNCGQFGVGRFCALAAAHRETIPVCPFWEEADHEMSVHTKLPAAERGVPH